jgi:hypothetical protein
MKTFFEGVNPRYNDPKLHPIGATHPKYPEYFRAPLRELQAADLITNSCEECPMDANVPTCDYSCGSGNAWVPATTWLRLRIWENQR